MDHKLIFISAIAKFDCVELNQANCCTHPWRTPEIPISLSFHVICIFYRCTPPLILFMNILGTFPIEILGFFWASKRRSRSQKALFGRRTLKSKRAESRSDFQLKTFGAGVLRGTPSQHRTFFALRSSSDRRVRSASWGLFSRHRRHFSSRRRASRSRPRIRQSMNTATPWCVDNAIVNVWIGFVIRKNGLILSGPSSPFTLAEIYCT